jgi:hypothetical protein
MRLSFLIVLLLIFSSGLKAQKAILLNNPSFEDEHGHSKVPIGWYYCGPVNRSPPDIHHTDFPRIYFQVEMPAADGHTYLGMIAREDGSVEGIGQHLSTPLRAGQCYTFSFFAARSEIYRSQSVSSPKFVNYNQPVSLAIWGGSKNCLQESLLGMSALVTHAEWKKHLITITPEEEYTHLYFQVVYDPARHHSYNGNILLDGFSPIIPVNCEQANTSIDYELPVIVIPEFDATYQLESHLRSLGMQIQTDDTGYLLKPDYFIDQKGKSQQGNLPLWSIATAIADKPFYKMEWMVAERDLNKRFSLQRQLNYTLQQAGLSPDEYIILDYKRSLSRSKEWLWPKSAGKIMLRLIPLNK